MSAAEKILGGDLRALARAATEIENGQGDALLEELFPHTGRALIVGVTGAPGSGKSTLCDQMTRLYRAQGKKVAILAVDPSSPFSGGAILGDRIRMQHHYADPHVFIRSMATRGWLGGLSRATTEISMLLDAAGYDVVIVETVGVGQDEVDIARLAQVTLVVLTPSMGDDVQALKAGIMEIAQVFVINKADLPGADKLERDLRNTFALAHSGEPEPEVVQTAANEGRGITELLAAVERFRAAQGAGESRAALVWSWRLREMLRERLLERLGEQEFLEAGREVAEHKRSPYRILNDWLKRI